MNTMLTVAGSDSIGGAGIQADLKTALACGVYSMSVVTSVTAQNTVGVQGVFDVPKEAIAQQMDSVFTDVPPDAVKVGMVSNCDTIETIAERLRYYEARNVVYDTVMVSTSGRSLLSEGAVDTLRDVLVPLATLVTPNVHEAEVLSGVEVSSKGDMLHAAEAISRYYGGNVLVKGGHLSDCADDLLYTSDGEVVWFENARIDNPNTHGTGCTLSSAIASYLAKGYSVRESVGLAKR